MTDIVTSPRSPDSDTNLQDLPSWGLVDFSGVSVFPEMQQIVVTSSTGPNDSDTGLNTPPSMMDTPKKQATLTPSSRVTSLSSNARRNAHADVGGDRASEVETCANLEGVVMSLRDVHVENREKPLDMKNVGCVRACDVIIMCSKS